jgi:hypothetical protein
VVAVVFSVADIVDADKADGHGEHLAIYPGFVLSIKG